MVASQLYQKYSQPPSLFDARLSGEFANLYTYIAGTLGIPIAISSGGTNSTTALNNNRVMKSSAGAIVEAAAITAARALISDVNGIPTQSTVTSTTLAFLDATSSVQTQLNGKEPTLTKGNLSDVGTDGITIGNGASAVIGSGTTISQHVADSTHNGYLTSTDWSTFNGKQASGSYITSLTGGVTASGPGAAAATVVTNANLTGPITSVGNATSIGSQTGTGSKFVVDNGPTLIAPLLGTPASGVLTNCTSIPVANATGTLAVNHGGTGQTALSAFVPTVQKFNSGSGTYTTPANVTWIKVTVVGGGGQGAGGGTGSPTAGSAGTASTFGTTLLTANGGTGGLLSSTGSAAGGGSVTVNSPAVDIGSVVGGQGQGKTSTAIAFEAGGIGGSTIFGGAGAGSANAGGNAGAANSGAGGAGGGVGAAGANPGGGGGSGGAIQAIITAPSASYGYGVGAGGSAAGAAGTGGFAGGAGGAGVVIVEEHYI